jgi:hypothetical protein
MVSLTTSVLIPQYAIAINYAYFPTLNPNVLSFIVALICVLPFMLFFRLRARNTRTVDELVGLTSLSPPFASIHFWCFVLSMMKPLSPLQPRR